MANMRKRRAMFVLDGGVEAGERADEVGWTSPPPLSQSWR